MIALMDALEIDRCHLVGLSMGGTTAIGMALEHPKRIASLTLVSTSAAGFDSGIKIKKIDELARRQGIQVARRRWIQSSLRYFPSEKKHVRDLLEKMMLDHSGAFWADPMRGKYPVENDLSRVHQIKLPTLILAGELDRPFVPLAEMLHDKIAGSHLKIYSGTGHMLNLEAPSRFRGDVKAFLEADAA
jgi:pimeloyl-ACP methyl ester carboxylesterase